MRSATPTAVMPGSDATARLICSMATGARAAIAASVDGSIAITSARESSKPGSSCRVPRKPFLPFGPNASFPSKVQLVRLTVEPAETKMPPPLVWLPSAMVRLARFNVALLVTKKTRTALLLLVLPLISTVNPAPSMVASLVICSVLARTMVPLAANVTASLLVNAATRLAWVKFVMTVA
jgi:hypothetical protein